MDLLLLQAFCLAMSAHISLLRSLRYHKLALRVHISVENVEYKAGCNGTQFTTTVSDATSAICDSMDTHLVPVVFEEAARVQSTAPIAMELHFYLLDIPPQPPVTEWSPTNYGDYLSSTWFEDLENLNWWKKLSRKILIKTAVMNLTQTDWFDCNKTGKT